MRRSDWIADEAAAILRDTIAEADGVEVLAVGATSPGDPLCVDVLTVHARGRPDAVPALAERAGPGDVLIHNHPSGDLQPSEADLAIATRLGARGVGMYIVDNEVERLRPVVHPWRAAPVTLVSAEAVGDVLGPDGRMANAHKGFAPREAQLAMADAVRRRLAGGAAAMLEAGTGVGKSYAYLVPAALHAEANRGTVIVSTATIALQQQLWEKDLPAVRQALGVSLPAVLLKGRGQYVSIRRAREWLAEPVETLAGTADRALIADWLEGTTTGDKGELPTELSPEVWEDIRSEGDNCLRGQCPHFQSCHFFRSRREAASARIVIVNHALLGADLKVRAETDTGFGETMLLPPYQHLIVDEAHALEGYVRNQFSVRTGELAIVRTLHQLWRERGGRGFLPRLRQRMADRAQALTSEAQRRILAGIEAAQIEIVGAAGAVSHWFGAFDQWLVDARLDDARRLPAEEIEGFAALRDEGLACADGLARVAAAVGSIVEPRDADRWPPELAAAWLAVAGRGERLRQHGLALRAVLTNRSPREVAWVERQGRQRRPILELAPVEVGGLLADRLWSRLRSVILTSATLTTAPDDFRFLGRGLGIDPDSCETQALPSPFPFPNLVLLAIVRGTPEVAAVRELVVASAGRALVLCTSHAAVRRIAAELRRVPELRSIRILAQGEAPPQRLAEEFRADIDAVLVGTASFWEGFDAAGETLRHVVVTKLPFSVPTHPLEAARHAWVDAQGGDAFRDLSLPEAVMRFRQGFGRLVRTPVDWGAVSILDERVRTRGYGRRFLAALPVEPSVEGTAADVAAAIRQWFAAREAALRST